MKFDVNEQVTQELKFKPDPAVNNGICLGKLIQVEVRKTEANEAKLGQSEYAGMSLPYLVFRFQQHKANADDPDRFYTHVERVINSQMKDGTDIESDTLSSLYNTMWFRLKHMYDQLGGPKLVQKEVDKVVPDENADVDKRLAQFEAFFNFFADKFNTGNDGKMLAKGKLLAMKLIADYTSRKFYTFPTFVGQGFIEIAKFDTKGRLNTTLEIKPNESIELGAGAKPSSSNNEGGIDDLPDHVKALLAKQGQ